MGENYHQEAGFYRSVHFCTDEAATSRRAASEGKHTILGAPSCDLAWKSQSYKTLSHSRAHPSLARRTHASVLLIVLPI